MPNDPDAWGSLPTPLTFVAGCLILAVVLVREIRKLIAERNNDQADQIKAQAEQIKALRDDITELTTEVEQLRDRAMADARESHEKQIGLVRENARLTTLLAKHGINPQETP